MKPGLVVAALLAGSAQAADMTVLRYLDQDPGDPPYATRILVTPDFLRMDDGGDDGDFVLLDRKRKKVINVMRDAKRAMVFSPGAVPASPPHWRAKLIAQAAAAGMRRYRLVVNHAVCSEGTVARHPAPDAARALAELKTVLAATQYRVWKDTPREMRHDCDLANQVWQADAVLKLGLPVTEHEFAGRTRHLDGRLKAPLQPELFRVPDGLPLIEAPS